MPAKNRRTPGKPATTAPAAGGPSHASTSVGASAAPSRSAAGSNAANRDQAAEAVGTGSDTPMLDAVSSVGRGPEGDVAAADPGEVAQLNELMSRSFWDANWAVTDGDVESALAIFHGHSYGERRALMREVDPSTMDELFSEFDSDNAEMQALRDELQEDWAVVQRYRDAPMSEIDDEDPLVVGGMDHDDVVQAEDTRSCYFLASVAAVADRDPELLADRITDNGDGTYDVRLYDTNLGEDVTTTVTDLPMVDGVPSQGHSEERDGAGNPELWPAILERAYGEMWGGYEDIQGGTAAEGMAALFGDEGEEVRIGNGHNERQLGSLHTALDGGEAVVASTGSHVVAVLGIEGEGLGSEVTIYNQQAEEGEREETIPWSEFVNRYEYFQHHATAPSDA